MAPAAAVIYADVGQVAETVLAEDVGVTALFEIVGAVTLFEDAGEPDEVQPARSNTNKRGIATP